MIRLSGRTVLTSSPADTVCPVLVRIVEEQTIKVSFMSCCFEQISPCIAQGAAKTFHFRDKSASADYTGATEITFDVWNSASIVLSRSLSGSTITVPEDRTFRLSISNADSAALPAGRLYCEAWVTTSTGDRRLVGKGDFIVEDTRKHDA